MSRWYILLLLGQSVFVYVNIRGFVVYLEFTSRHSFVNFVYCGNWKFAL